MPRSAAGIQLAPKSASTHAVGTMSPRAAQNMRGAVAQGERERAQRASSTARSSDHPSSRARNPRTRRVMVLARACRAPRQRRTEPAPPSSRSGAPHGSVGASTPSGRSGAVRAELSAVGHGMPPARYSYEHGRPRPWNRSTTGTTTVPLRCQRRPTWAKLGRRCLPYQRLRGTARWPS